MNRARIGVVTIAALCLGLALSSCSPASTSEGTSSSTGTTPSETPAAPLDLVGEWKQTNSASADAWQSATIAGETITVNWVSEGGATTSLYWAGTYVPPAEPRDSYTWDSQNDHSQTDTALLASGDDTKTFTYEGGVLSYEVTALGTTTTVQLERQ